MQSVTCGWVMPRSDADRSDIPHNGRRARVARPCSRVAADFGKVRQRAAVVEVEVRDAHGVNDGVELVGGREVHKVREATLVVVSHVHPAVEHDLRPARAADAAS